MNNEDIAEYEGKEIEFEVLYPELKLKGLVKKDKDNYYIEVHENNFSAKVPAKYIFRIIKGDGK